MGERSDEIELQIREKRNELSENFSELERKVKTAMDWREQFRQHPGTLLSVAFGGGALLAALFPLRSSGARYRSRVQSYSLDDPAARRPADLAPTSAAKHSEAKENLDALRGAVVGIAVNRLTGLIDGLMPGFQQEFLRARKNSRDRFRQSDPSGQSQSYAPAETQSYESPEYGKPS